VSSPDSETSREIETGTSDRQTNMVLFAEELLKFFLQVLTGESTGRKTSL
jgi:hypothetical protein